MNKHGKMSWKDESFSTGEKNGKDTFLRLSPGSNVVRLITDPHLYNQHKYKIPGEKGYGHRITCSKTEEDNSCVLCSEKNDKPKKRWFIGVIERKTNTYKILDIGYAVFKNIKTIASSDDWGDPSGYDVDIVVDPKGGATSYYTVVAKPPKALTASDLKIRDENPEDVLDRMTTPPASAKTEEKLNKLMAEFSASTPSQSQSSDDSDFTDYDTAATEKKAPF